MSDSEILYEIIDTAGDSNLVVTSLSNFKKVGEMISEYPELKERINKLGCFTCYNMEDGRLCK